jgi:hypothetical protein
MATRSCSRDILIVDEFFGRFVVVLYARLASRGGRDIPQGCLATPHLEESSTAHAQHNPHPAGKKHEGRYMGDKKMLSHCVVLKGAV